MILWNYKRNRNKAPQMFTKKSGQKYGGYAKQDMNGEP